MFIGQVVSLDIDPLNERRLQELHRAQAVPTTVDGRVAVNHYAVAVRLGRETPVCEAMRAEGIDAWVPRTWAEIGQASRRGGRPPKRKDLVNVIATPGYVVVRFFPSPEGLYGLLSFDDVIGVLGVRSESQVSSHCIAETILPLFESEVDRLREQEDISNIDFSTAWRSPFAPGRKVHGKLGILQGLVGTVSVKRASRGCVWVDFDTHGQITSWQLAVDDLEKYR